MKRAVVITRWIGDGLTPATAFRPKITDDYPVLEWRDVTGGRGDRIPPDRNLVLIEVLVSDAVAAQAAGDAGVHVLRVDPQPEEGTLGAAARTALRNFLQARGMTLAEAQEALGVDFSGLTRREIIEALARWLRGRGKG